MSQSVMNQPLISQSVMNQSVIRNTFILFTLALSIIPLTAFSNDKVADADIAALMWLSNLDSEQYEMTWSDAASGFRDRTSQQQWNETVTFTRKPLGALRERSLRNSDIITNPEGAPEGEYIRLQYTSASEYKHKVVETVTLVLEDERWRATGYFVYSVSACPENLWESNDQNSVLSHFKKLDLRLLQDRPQSKCAPKTFSKLALGSPLCLFDGKVRVRGAYIKLFVEDKTLIEYKYLVGYSSKRHEELFAILNERYEIVPVTSYPDQLKSMPINEVLTALFKTKDNTYVALQKPGKGSRGSWHSVVRFTQEKLLDISRRNDNTCK